MIEKFGVSVLFCTIWLSTGCRSQSAPIVPLNKSPNATASSTTPRVFSVVEGSSSWLYLKTAGAGTIHRLTDRKSGWETDGVLSPNGDAVAYALAEGPEAKSEVWLSRVDGSHAHRVSNPEEDAVMPAFCPDGQTLLYVKSRFNGHYSPIARPRRHKFDVVKVLVSADGPIGGVAPEELTQQEFFDLRSLSVSTDGERFLVSTTGYPIGSLIEEFDIAKPLQIKRIFQPHVPSEPSSGPSFGEAAYVHDGMDIVFTAATEGKGGMFDYNVYQMSDVTGAEIVALTHQTGMIDEMSVGRDGTIFISGGGHHYSLNPQSRAIEQD